MVKSGNRQRFSFSRIDEVLPIPNLIEVQQSSYQWFLNVGLKELLRDISPVQDFTNNLSLYFGDYRLGEPKYSVENSKERDVTYAAPLRVKVRLSNKQTGEIKEQEVFMGDFPLMTDQGTFIINGAERVIVSQLVRSPGAYFVWSVDANNNRLFSSQIIPNRGAWLEFETDNNQVLYTRIDRNRKIPVTVLLRVLGLVQNADILDYFNDDARLRATLEKDVTDSRLTALFEIYKKLRPGEPPTEDSAMNLIRTLFFDPRRYDLMQVGRYKLNKKLAIQRRALGRVASRTVVAEENIYSHEGTLSIAAGEVLVSKGETLRREHFQKLMECGVNEVFVFAADGEHEIKIIGNGYHGTTWQSRLLGQRVADSVFYKEQLIIGDGEIITEEHVASLVSMVEEGKIRSVKIRHDEELETVYLGPVYSPRDEKHLTNDDILAAISYQLNIMDNLGNRDDIDHLGNRRLRSVGELLQNQFRVGLARMERVIRERMSIQNTEQVTPQALINIRPVVASIKEFFGSSQLSQFMDQTNPLAELAHKRRLSALGPGGLSRDRAGFEVRDVHHSHYGRMCPIESPEGPNIGLIGSLTTYARINKYGFIETPYRLVDKEKGLVTKTIDYLTADEEDEFICTQANTPLTEDHYFAEEKVTVRLRNLEIKQVLPNEVDYMDVSPKQLFSVPTTLIPFLENDDASRALMGSNMQKQAVPLLVPKAPIIGTGMEGKAAIDSGVCVISRRAGVVIRATADEIKVLGDDNEVDTFRLTKFTRSNQGTCMNQRVICTRGQRVETGSVLADGPATEQGELALGKNVLAAYMPWEGYNYEDAILLSEKVVREDIFTSIHIEEYESDARDTKLGPEEITRDIPNVGEDQLRDLDDRGIVRIGADVRSGDILVGKVTPKGETELTAEERLLRAIFGEKAREVRDTSLRVPNGEAGKIVDVKVFSRENNDELPPGVNQLVRVYIAQKRKISVGDKMAGRHGNKGVVSRIMAEEDMPFLPDGTPIQIVLNPLGVPSRMNIGQILEVHLGAAANRLGLHIATPVFDGAGEEDVLQALRESGLERDGKTVLFDGRTGEAFENRVTVGYVYMLKLFHLVDDKIHARSTGPYSLVTQQPLGGKAQFGGQRFGEMEVWALEAYGAAYTLQELLTVKSDDVIGRVKTYEAIVKGENVPEPGIPESFKVLIKELQSLGLDVKVYSADAEEIIIRETDDDIGETAKELDLNIESVEPEVADDDLDDLDEEEEEDDDLILDFPAIDTHRDDLTEKAPEKKELIIDEAKLAQLAKLVAAKLEDEFLDDDLLESDEDEEDEDEEDDEPVMN